MSETNNKLNLKSKISNSLREIVKDLTGEDVEPEITVNNDLIKGDFSTNIAMIAFGSIKNKVSPLRQGSAGQARIKNHGSPMELAEEVIRILNTKYLIPNTFRFVEAKPPGFINFWLSREAISRQVSEVLRSSEKVEFVGKSNTQPSSSLILEFGDPNPFKEPHIGHLRNFAIGESLARLFEASGNKVIRANYQGDVGMHVAKCLYGIFKLNLKNKILNLGNEDVGEGAKALGEAYVFGAEKFEIDDKAKEEIIAINKKIYSADTEIYSLWQKGRRLSLDYFETFYKKLGIKYYKYYFESETAPVGLEIVKKHVGKVFEADAGAIIFRGEKYGLHTRVFITKEGNPTYEAKDLALAVLKNQDFPDVNKSIIMTANEQVEYFKVLFAALKLVDPEIAGKTTHLSYGFVNLKEGKMSSRTGNVVTAFWLLEETKKRLKNGFKEVSDDVLEQLSVGAVKWSMLKFSRESSITFSIDESIQIEGNSGPYMQYAYARTQSILGKSDKTGFARLASRQEAKGNIDWREQELALARLICQFENVVLDAKNSFSPNILCNYLFNLAQNFNHFYEKEKVIGSEREEEKLVIVNAVGKVLKKGLYLLGISAPEKI